MTDLIAAIVMILNVLEGYSLIASLFKCDILCLWHVVKSLCICRACIYTLAVPNTAMPGHLLLAFSVFAAQDSTKQLWWWYEAHGKYKQNY